MKVAVSGKGGTGKTTIARLERWAAPVHEADGLTIVVGDQ